MQTKVIADEKSIRTTSILPKSSGQLIDIRTLEQNGRMHLVLVLNLPDGRTIQTNRYFDKASDSFDESEIELDPKELI